MEIREYRKKRKYTQEQIAEILGISWRHYQRIEIGKGKPSIDILLDIIDVLEINDEDVIKILNNLKNIK